MVQLLRPKNELQLHACQLRLAAVSAMWAYRQPTAVALVAMHVNKFGRVKGSCEEFPYIRTTGELTGAEYQSAMGGACKQAIYSVKGNKYNDTDMGRQCTILHWSKISVDMRGKRTAQKLNVAESVAPRSACVECVSP